MKTINKELLSRAIQTRAAADIAEERKLPYAVGNLFSADIFYNDDPNVTPNWQKLGALAVEMEAAGLYMNAARAGKKALAICTISDHLYTDEHLSADERQTSFTQMMELALAVAVDMA